MPLRAFRALGNLRVGCVVALLRIIGALAALRARKALVAQTVQCYGFEFMYLRSKFKFELHPFNVFACIIGLHFHKGCGV
jgi:hypothetical protein